jgi:hypothetical protein
MPAITAASLLDALDRGVRASSAERALLLLTVFRPEPYERLTAMPLGWVTARLLEFRAALIGPTLECLSDCRQCGVVIESAIPVAQLTAATGEPAPNSEMIRLQHDMYEIEFRLPASADLLGLEGDTTSASRGLGQRLISHASRAGEPVPVADLPAEVHGSLERAVLEHDPLAHVELELVCPGCGSRWMETLDVAEFVWQEVFTLGQRLLADVARLAYAFGWREAEILAMSDQRRRRYLELLPA